MSESDHLILQIGDIARRDLELGTAMEMVARLVTGHFHVDSTAVLIYDPSSRSAYVQASAAAEEGLLLVPQDITLRVTSGSCLHQSLESPGKPLFVPDGSEDPVLGTAPGTPVAVIPMTSGGKASGFMLLSGKDRQALLRLDVDLLMAVAALASLMASSAGLAGSLMQSEERYRMLTENAAGLAFVLDRAGRFLYVNQRVRDVLGYEPDELVGRYFGEFVTPEAWARTTAVVKNAASKQEKYVEYDWVAQKKDGTQVTLAVEASLLYQGFEIYRHQGIARDASTEMLLKEELQKRGQELSAVRSREERMREYLTVANMAQEEERARIARDIHDGAVQYLVAMRRRLDLFRKEFLKEPKDTRKRPAPEVLLGDIDSLLDTATSDLRQFARNLRPPVLDDFGLVSACEWLADQTRKEGIKVLFSLKGEVRRLPQELEVSAFRIVQEGLANAVKHSGAGQVELSIEFGPAALDILLADNGKGFEFSDQSGSLGRAGQMGLIGMFERAELIGAALDVHSEPGRGTTLSVRIPLPL